MLKFKGIIAPILGATLTVSIIFINYCFCSCAFYN
jgi:hypothetical protein